MMTDTNADVALLTEQRYTAPLLPRRIGICTTSCAMTSCCNRLWHVTPSRRYGSTGPLNYGSRLPQSTSDRSVFYLSVPNVRNFVGVMPVAERKARVKALWS